MEKDAEQIYRLSNWIAEHGDYPARLWLDNLLIVFPYPPPTPLMFAASGAAGPALVPLDLDHDDRGGVRLEYQSLFPERTGGDPSAEAARRMVGLLIAGSAVSWDSSVRQFELIG
jgi:hypothetical protein